MTTETQMGKLRINDGDVEMSNRPRTPSKLGVKPDLSRRPRLTYSQNLSLT